MSAVRMHACALYNISFLINIVSPLFIYVGDLLRRAVLCTSSSLLRAVYLGAEMLKLFILFLA